MLHRYPIRLVTIATLFICAFGAGAELKITVGLTPYQVAQCNAEGKGLILCSGTWSGENGPLSMRKVNFPNDSVLHGLFSYSVISSNCTTSPSGANSSQSVLPPKSMVRV